MTTKKSVRRVGFTLVELLVVIAIIGMLAGLMLPAVQQAREAGRRAECTNNQKNVALAILNYEGARKSFPGFRQQAGDVEAASWYFAIFPYVEQSNIYEKLQECTTPHTLPDRHMLDYAVRTERAAQDYQSYAIAVFKCTSAADRNSSRVNYVANCGPSNVSTTAGPWGLAATTLYTPVNDVSVTVAPNSGTAYTVAFEHGGYTAVFFNKCTWDTAVANFDTSSVNLEYISSKTGTSNTLLTSENVNAGNWYNTEEQEVGFCYPWMRGATPSQPTWEPLASVTANPTAGTYTPATSMGFPLWINSGKDKAIADLGLHRRARPSSNHPGIVVCAFCDGSVRTASESMDKPTFINAMQPGGSGIFGANAFN